MAAPEEKEDYNYEIYGVVNHINFGSYGGHYTAHVRGLEDQEGSTGTWYKCNDSVISKINEEREIIPSTAYILFLK